MVLVAAYVYRLKSQLLMNRPGNPGG
jgi:hypothetical protein